LQLLDLLAPLPQLRILIYQCRLQTGGLGLCILQLAGSHGLGLCRRRRHLCNQPLLRHAFAVSRLSCSSPLCGCAARSLKVGLGAAALRLGGCAGCLEVAVGCFQLAPALVYGSLKLLTLLRMLCSRGLSL
jgi:hypothetical protein